MQFLFLLMFVPAAAIASGLIAYSMLRQEDYIDYYTDYEDDYVYQMYEYYVEEE